MGILSLEDEPCKKQPRSVLTRFPSKWPFQMQFHRMQQCTLLFFVPLATLLSLRVLPEFKKKAVWTRAYGWWSIGVASSILSWMWKTTEMEGFQNSCLGALSYDAEGRGAWKGGRRTDAWPVRAKRRGHCFGAQASWDWNQNLNFLLFG